MADGTVTTSKHVSVTPTVYHLAISEAAWQNVEIMNQDAIGGDVVYVTVGSSTVTDPTVAGDNTTAVMPSGSVSLPLPNETTRGVKLISSGTALVSVNAWGRRP